MNVGRNESFAFCNQLTGFNDITFSDYRNSGCPKVLVYRYADLLG